METGKVNHSGQAGIGPRTAIEPERLENLESLGHLGSGAVDADPVRLALLRILTAEVDLKAYRGVPRHADRPDPLDALAEEARWSHGDEFLRAAARHAILNDQIDVTGEELPP
jgi:hypothetical protein